MRSPCKQCNREHCQPVGYIALDVFRVYNPGKVLQVVPRQYRTHWQDGAPQDMPQRARSGADGAAPPGAFRCMSLHLSSELTGACTRRAACTAVLYVIAYTIKLLGRTDMGVGCVARPAHCSA
jgi:hypothetical protein